MVLNSNILSREIPTPCYGFDDLKPTEKTIRDVERSQLWPKSSIPLVPPLLSKPMEAAPFEVVRSINLYVCAGKVEPRCSICLVRCK